MNLSLDLANSIQDAIDTAQQRDLTLVTFLASLSVIGVLVNSVLLDVYLHTRRKVLSTYFITAVVAIDLIISGVVMPLKIVLVVTRVSVELCAICLSLSYGCIGVSIMLFFCITFDRYQCVCLITRPLITTRNLHLVGSWAAFSALYAGLVAPIYLRGEITLLDDASADDNTRNGNGNGSQPLALREVTLLMRPGYPCYTTTLLSHPRRVWDSRYTVQFVFAVCCSSLVLMVLVLYVLMFLRLRQKDQFRLQLITDKRQGFPKELTARPCCDINDLPPLQKLGAVRHDKMSECQSTSDEFHPSSENTANDDVQPTKVSNKQPESEIERNNKACSESFKNDVAKTKDLSITTQKASYLIRSISCLHQTDVIKVHRRKCQAVEALQETEQKLSKGPSISQNLITFTGSANHSSNVISVKPTTTNREPQKIKVKRHHPLASMSCFRRNHTNEKLESLSLEDFSSNFFTDTDSVCSEPDCAHQTLNTNFRLGRGRHTVIHGMNRADSDISAHLSPLDDSTARCRSFSCSETESATKQTKHTKFRYIYNRRCEEKRCPNRTEINVNLACQLCLPQDKERSSIEININNKRISESCVSQDITSIEQKHYKHESTEADCLTTKHEDSTLNDGKQSSTYSPTENNSAFTVTNVKTMSVKSSTPVINPSQETHSPANQVQPSNTKSNPKAVSLTKQNPLVDSSDSSQTKHTQYGDTKTKTHRDSGQSGRSGCCVQPQISLSTRVTARVGLLTLAYCLWWTPFYLSELGLVHYSALMPDIFFMANVMNPLLHLMTSQLFRHQVKARLKVYSARLTARCYPQSSKA